MPLRPFFWFAALSPRFKNSKEKRKKSEIGSMRRNSFQTGTLLTSQEEGMLLKELRGRRN